MTSFNVETIKITRQQYDALIDRYPSYMKTDWLQRFNHKWSLSGVRCEGMTDWCADLEERVEQCEAAEGAKR